jgi:GTP-binding protein
MGESRLPFAIIFTKADKLKSPDLIVNTEAFKKKLLESWEELPPFFITSSFRKHGGETILQYVDECNHIILHEG